MIDLNRDGQPTNAYFNQHRNLIKGVEALLGIIRGLLADSKLSREEISFLDLWLSENPEITKSWPGDIIAKRIEEIMADGIITDEEIEDLKETLSQIIGGGIWQDGVADGMSTTLPLDLVDRLCFEGQTFCLTGKFILGPRLKCEKEIESRGGLIQPRVVKDLNYLVVGALASRDWVNTSYGRKIEKAMEIKKKGSPLLIVGEDKFGKFLG